MVSAETRRPAENWTSRPSPNPPRRSWSALVEAGYRFEPRNSCPPPAAASSVRPTTSRPSPA